MKYLTMKQNALAIFIAITLTGSIAHAAPKGPVNHGQATAWIQSDFKCEHDYAQIIKEFLENINDTIYNFLDYAHNKQKLQEHIATFNRYIKQLHTIIEKGKSCKQNAKAVEELKKIVAELSKIGTDIQGAKGKNGTTAATVLGAKLKPAIEKLESYLPVSLTAKERLMSSYGHTSVGPLTYIEHLAKRLAIQ